MENIFHALSKWLDAVKCGADPIEAMHGHYCQPGCMHWEFLTDEEKKKALKVLEAMKKFKTKG
jgi:glycerol dehydrogenase-like iron-containing ADH family enzyme